MGALNLVMVAPGFGLPKQRVHSYKSVSEFYKGLSVTYLSIDKFGGVTFRDNRDWDLLADLPVSLRIEIQAIQSVRNDKSPTYELLIAVGYLVRVTRIKSSDSKVIWRRQEL